MGAGPHRRKERHFRYRLLQIVHARPPPPHEPACHVKRFRGGLVFRAHRLLFHSTLGSRVIKKENPPAEFVRGGRVLTGVPRS